MVELMVALAIMAVVITGAVVGGNRYWLNQHGLSAAVEQLRGDMQRARLLAVKRNANCVISLNDPANNQYTISLSNKVVNFREDYRGGVVFAGPSMGPVNITFSPMGTCTFGGPVCVGGQVQLTDQGNAILVPNGDTVFYRLRISAAGGISKQVWNGANWVSSRI